MNENTTPRCTVAVMIDPRHKLRHAFDIIEDLSGKAKILPSRWYAFVVEPAPQKGYHQLSYKPQRDIIAEFSLLIGDCLGNMRSALDQLASAIARVSNPDARIYFPIPESENTLKQSPYLRAMEKTLPGVADLLVKAAAAAASTSPSLWRFTNINNDDKHNFLTPITRVSNITNISAITGNFSVLDFGKIEDPSHEISLITSNLPIILTGSPIVSVVLYFGDESPFRGQEVVSTLLKLHKLIDDVLSQIEQLIGAPRPT